MGRRRERGQAAVETIGVAIGLAVVSLIGWQLVAAAYAWQAVQSSARNAARAGSVGAPVERAALAALPDRLAKRAVIRMGPGSGGAPVVRVQAPIPRVVTWLGPLGWVTGDARSTR